MNDIRVLVIRPGRTPERRTIPNTLEAKQTIVEGYIEAIDPGDGTTIWCNEEGKILGLAPNRALRAQKDTATHRRGEITDIICGTFLICGYDPETGEDGSLTDEQADRWERLLHDPQTLYRTPAGRIGMIPVHPID